MSDPYAEFGGQQVQQGGDPYAEFGGKASTTDYAAQAPPLKPQYVVPQKNRVGQVYDVAKGLLSVAANNNPVTMSRNMITQQQVPVQPPQQPLSLSDFAKDASVQNIIGSMGLPKLSGDTTEEKIGQGIGAGVLAVQSLRGGARALPSKAFAESLLDSAESQAGKLPVELKNSQEGISNLIDWQAKTQLGPTINKFLNRVTKPNSPPLTYAEARDFYGLLGKLSADEVSKLAPAARADLTKAVVGLKQDIGNTAAQVGAAADYYAGMREYAMASRLKSLQQDIMKWVVKPAIGTAAATAGGAAGYGAYKALTK